MQMLNTQKTQNENKEAPSEKSSTLMPSLSLPKGGGAIKGIDEKFSANPLTGTGTLNVPVFTTASRSDFYPRLSLSYDSGSGNGPFGIGWSLSVPSITRKTEKGLPKYQDAIDSDLFILSEAEDLVPSLIFTGEKWTGEILERSEQNVSYRVRRYRPRVEGLFARIEQWENKETGEKHWRSTSKDNITSLYGTAASSRLADPEDSSRVFKWLLAESFDDRGNVILYEYKQGNQDAIDASSPQEKNRLGPPQEFVNRYLKRIKYGNRIPYQRDDWFFEVVFDYGEHDSEIPTVDEAHPWISRPDPFSSFRARFEVRTYRLCQRVLMFHRFKELGDALCLVRSTDLTYKVNALATYLTSITSTGYIRRSGPAGTYDKKSLPPLEITYTEPVIDEELHFVDSASLENLPMGLDGTRYQWVDLDSEGISGILSEQASAWFYKRNLGNAQFAPVQLVATKPSTANLQSGQQQIMDLAGDGHKYLVQFDVPLRGFYEHREDGQWGPFTPFLHAPNVPWNSPNLKFIDLDGDGHSDILHSEEEVFTWYRSLTKEGFEAAETVRKPFDEEKGPALVFSDATQSIYLADMVGDGLTDIVRVRNGEICYWPNKGYGNFGARVTMDVSPLFDHPDYFDQKRVRLADIDGSGTTDIVYLGRDAITFWFNQAGNSWSEAHTLKNFPATDSLDSVAVIDLLGNGTACIVWSSPLPDGIGQPMRYIDLMSGQKPHLLQTITNNMGKETKIQYAPSTKFYLADQADGRPWVTKLPFPVHVVERVETHDGVAETTFVTTYRYHHGYYDGIEREFRGFGCVEEWDAESFAQFKRGATSASSLRIVEEDLYVPPVHTKTWFHTGAYFDSQNISQHFVHEYYRDDPLATLLPDTHLPPGLTVQEEEEACRALRGRILRRETYAEDKTTLSPHPYTVSEHTYAINLIQPVQNNPYGVFHVYEREAVEFHYERHPEDPRIGHHLTLEVDAFGNILKSAAVGYPRRIPAYPEQARTLITYTESDFINRADVASFFRVGVPSETRNYEITGVINPGAGILSFDDLRSKLQDAAAISYEVEPLSDTVHKRIIEHSRTVYYKDDLSGPLPLGQVESHALTYQNYKMALTPGLVAKAYENRASEALLTTEGKYHQQDGNWWLPSSRAVPDAASFYQPLQFVDPLGNVSTIAYDPYSLLVVQTKDPLGNTTQARNNYRTMLPAQVTDFNDNSPAVLFDALGMVVATAVMGKIGKNEGDTLTDPTTHLEYELFRWKQQHKPNYVHTFAREQHGQANPRWQESFTYSDGSGRESMRKIQAEPGLAQAIDSQGNIITLDTSPHVRWVGTGRTIFDNKGNAVKKYEPYFSITSEFETEKTLVEQGVSSILRYDPMGRLIRTDHPNGTFSRVDFDAWKRITWDENDTVLESRWYADRQALADVPAYQPERRAAQLTKEHANTPSVAHFDVLGRSFLTIVDNGSFGKYQTHMKLDIEGNHLVITDARTNIVTTSIFDMLKHKLYLYSMDAGEHWTLHNVAEHPIREWDSRIGDSQGYTIRHLYDELQRPYHMFAQRGTEREVLAEKRVYGETHPNATEMNLRGKLYLYFDNAGVVLNEQFDFKGNLLRSSRRLANTYQAQVDWSASASLTAASAIAAASSLLESKGYTTNTVYDALNRPTSITMPDQSEIQSIYNEANFLEKLYVRLRGAQTATLFVKNLDYDAKGQRILAEYGNNVKTAYTYDPQTFRMTNLRTSRASDNALLQNLSYTYDPVGNIVEIHDDAQQVIFFNNAKVVPSALYVYDALYRLIQANGREHFAKNSSIPYEYDPSDTFRMNLPHPNDGNALQNYTEYYQYDSVGNILSVLHEAAGNTAWKRLYSYAKDSNRLQSTSLPADPATGPFSATYAYDSHGNMEKMPHLPLMHWNFENHLYQVDLGGGDTAYYVYDPGGRRVRKVVQTGSLIKERIYLNGYEIYRQYNGSGLVLERETLHIMDDKQRVALVETKTIDTSQPGISSASLIRYQLDNQLGSVTLELDEIGEIISYEEYYPYGSTAYQAGRNVVEVSLKRYRYSGKERDEETGFYYHGARYYVPWLGRWTSFDALELMKPGASGDITGYIYGHNNPINFSDPTGFISWGKVLGFAAAVVVGTAITVLTGGLAGPIVAAAIGGAIGGGVGSIIEQKIDKGQVDWKQVGIDAAIGGAAGALFAGAGVVGKALAKTKVGESIVKNVANSSAAQVVRSVGTRLAKTVVGKAAQAASRGVYRGFTRPLAIAGERLGFRLGGRFAERASEHQARRLVSEAVMAHTGKGATAALHYDIEGESELLVTRSGEKARLASPKGYNVPTPESGPGGKPDSSSMWLETHPTPDESGKVIDRFYDAEAKELEHLVNKFPNPDVTGKVFIGASKTICTSCSFGIDQAKFWLPNVGFETVAPHVLPPAAGAGAAGGAVPILRLEWDFPAKR